jgi:hypothetical protein
MRSIGSTLILALLAILTLGVATWHWVGGNFDSVFGTPPTPLGQLVYSKFDAAAVKNIQISQNNAVANFDLKENGWQAVVPWKDRMDPRAAMAIIDFTLGLRVEDYAARDDIKAQKAGLRENVIDIRLEDAAGRTLAKYKVGRQTPWLTLAQGAEQPAPTVYIQPRDLNRKRFIYACTGAIAPLFKDGLKQLRDHHPFYFNPNTLQKVRICNEQGEFTLARETPKSPWRVIKPLNLATDVKAVKSLIEGLYELQANAVSDRASTNLSASDVRAKSQQIAIQSFGTTTETVLEIYPPESPAARHVIATVSDRPDALFELPLKPETGMISLAGLPLAINDLRESTLTRLNIQSLRGISIQPATGAEITISRKPPLPWMATIEGQAQEANEERLYALLKAVTESRVTHFETDAAIEFAPWGLDRPFLKLRFLGQDNRALELNFGIDGNGGYFVNRLGSTTVTRVDPLLVASIPVRPYEWRQSRLWSVDRVNLMAIERQVDGHPALMLRYNFNQEAWTANCEDRDLSTSLDAARANYVLSTLEGLKVTRWLATDDESAINALAKPSLTLKILEKATNDQGDFMGLITRELILAPASETSNPGFYYGRVKSGDNPFLLDRETYRKIATEVFDEKLN